MVKCEYYRKRRACHTASAVAAPLQPLLLHKIGMTLNFRVGQGQMSTFQSKSDIPLSYQLSSALFILSVMVCEIFTVEKCKTLTLTFGMKQDQMYMPIESQYMTFPSMVKVIFFLTTKVCEISTSA